MDKWTISTLSNVVIWLLKHAKNLLIHLADPCNGSSCDIKAEPDQLHKRGILNKKWMFIWTYTVQTDMWILALFVQCTLHMKVIRIHKLIGARMMLQSHSQKVANIILCCPLNSNNLQYFAMQISTSHTGLVTDTAASGSREHVLNSYAGQVFTTPQSCGRTNTFRHSPSLQEEKKISRVQRSTTNTLHCSLQSSSKGLSVSTHIHKCKKQTPWIFPTKAIREVCFPQNLGCVGFWVQVGSEVCCRGFGRVCWLYK